MLGGIRVLEGIEVRWFPNEGQVICVEVSTFPKQFIFSREILDLVFYGDNLASIFLGELYELWYSLEVLFMG